MGTDTRSKLILGYEYDTLVIKESEIPIGEEWDDFDDFVRECLDSASPYFDSDMRDCIWGIDVCTSGYYTYSQVKDLMIKIEDSLCDLTKVLGEQFVNKYPPKVYLSAHIT